MKSVRFSAIGGNLRVWCKGCIDQVFKGDTDEQMA